MNFKIPRKYVPAVVRYAHQRVPQKLAFKLNIPQVKNDLASAQYINGPDVFEEFTHEESIVKRIANQVKESTLWLSFNEFLANAEDCTTATEVTWVLDSEQSKYPSKSPTLLLLLQLKAKPRRFSTIPFRLRVNVDFHSISMVDLRSLQIDGH